jgi:alkaline phosphatase isozyme conversion protein
MDYARVAWSVLGLMCVACVLAACGVPRTSTRLSASIAVRVPRSASSTVVLATGTPTPTAMPGAVARQHLTALSETIGSRVAGSPNETLAAQYVEAELKKLGYATVVQPFSAQATVNKAKVTIASANVVAIKPGLSTQEIIVGAHYDSVSKGKGADDNASGIAVLLEVAARVKDQPTPYTIRFVAFAAEEVEQKGSSAFATQMSPADVRNTIAMINLDSLIAGDLAYVYGSPGARGFLRDWTLAMAQKAGLDLRTQAGENKDYPAGTTGDWSDHAPFEKIGIPYVYLESTNWSLGDKDGYTQVDVKLGDQGEIWHTAYDNIKYIEDTFPGRIDQRLNLFVTVLENILTQFVKS